MCSEKTPRVYLLYQHDKDNWTVKLMSDGNLWILGTFKRKRDSYSCVSVDIPLEYLTLPKYVIPMIAGAKEEWREHNA